MGQLKTIKAAEEIKEKMIMLGKSADAANQLGDDLMMDFAAIGIEDELVSDVVNSLQNSEITASEAYDRLAHLLQFEEETAEESSETCECSEECPCEGDTTEEVQTVANPLPTIAGLSSRASETITGKVME